MMISLSSCLYAQGSNLQRLYSLKNLQILGCLKEHIGMLGNVHILRHHVRGGGGPDTNDDIDDALRGGGGVTIKMMM